MSVTFHSMYSGLNGWHFSIAVISDKSGKHITFFFGNFLHSFEIQGSGIFKEIGQTNRGFDEVVRIFIRSDESLHLFTWFSSSLIICYLHHFLNTSSFVVVVVASVAGSS